MTVKPWEPSGIIAECVNPEPQDIRHALDKKQVLWRWKNSRVQVLAQTLSNYLGTRTSSLLAVNKKHGVPEKFIHREWKQTWVNLDGLKKRVAQTGHSSALLKGLKQVIQCIDAVTADDRAVLSSVEQKKQETKPKAKPGTKHNPIDGCEVAVEAYERAVKNTGLINCLTRDEAALENFMFSTRDAVFTDLGAQSKRLDMLADRIHRIEVGDKQDKSIGHVANERAKDNADRLLELETRVNTMEAGDWKEKGKSVSLSVDELDARIVDLENKHKNLENETRNDWAYAKDAREYIADRVWHLEEWRKRVDKQATQATVNQTLLGDLNTRLGRLASQADSLDTKTDGLRSRVSVVENTNKWLSWTLAGVIGVRFLAVMLRWLKRK